MPEPTASGSTWRGEGLAGTGCRMNVNDAQQVESAVAAVQGQLGDISILVNNAGITRDNLLVRMKDEEWDEIMATDLKSVYRLSRLVLRGDDEGALRPDHQRHSVVGVTGNAGQTNYAAAKAGVIGFSKSLAREIGSRNITVNCVAPGSSIPT
jgi:3-oxoacyl-[acyl-carrier protein] reductase